jgi:outer membrane protein OmpA-like peptidoglycan-associated protein
MATEHEHTGLVSSLTDLMTSLAVIFILLLVAMLNNARQQAEGTKSQVLARLQKALEMFQKEGVQVTTDPKDPLGLLVVVPQGLLKFEQGEFQIPPDGEVFVRNFIPKFVRTACSADLRPGISSIVVEGHASSEGNEKLSQSEIEKFNLKLSQERSMSVVQESLDVLDDPSSGDSQDDHKCFVDFVSATGRGSAEPIETNGAEDKFLSRRVVFKIRVKSAEQRAFETNLGLSDVKQIGQ